MNRVMTDKELNFIGSVAPVELLSWGKGRRHAKLFIGDVKFIGTLLHIVLQRSPRNRKVFLTKAKETAENQDCISDLAGQLIDHYPLDHADLFTGWSMDRCSLRDHLQSNCEPWVPLLPKKRVMPMQSRDDTSASG
jgi:hypothetical protein